MRQRLARALLALQDVYGDDAENDGVFNGGTITEPLEIDAGADSVPFSVIADSFSRMRVSPDGYLIISRIDSPADEILQPGEVALWLDSSVGATKMKFKAKDNEGAVRTGQVSLS